MEAEKPISTTNTNHHKNEGEDEKIEEEDDDDKEGIELSLGLSLNGKFGVNPKPNNLKRSYSISNIITTTPVMERGINLALNRTCSLPVESEEESMKRKHIQMLRRREAKQRRADKQLRNGLFGMEGQGGVGFGFGFGFGVCLPPPLSQPSSASSSAVSEFDTLNTPPFSGMKRSRSAEAKSPESVQSVDQNEHRSLPTKLSSESGISELKTSRSISGTNDMVRNVLADMPYVSTKGDGPSGKRIEGFLYGYKNGEEVRIVCVCHGNFLTPAEFVKHAGGGDVKHPLRHIVVNTSSFL